MKPRVSVAFVVAIVLAAPALAKAQDAATPRRRMSWFADSRNFQVGEILTVFVDERTLAEESTSRVANSDRSQGANLGSGGDFTLGVEELSFNTSMENGSRDRGEVGRRGNLRGVASVRITEVASNGVLSIEGERTVSIDGRSQTMTITGFVRSEDVSPRNEVLSSRIAGAQIQYDGETISPRRGILGKILGIFWP